MNATEVPLAPWAPGCPWTPLATDVRTFLLYMLVWGTLSMLSHTRKPQPVNSWRLSRSLSDWVWAIVLGVTLGATIYHKLARGVYPWLLQPCHSANLLMMILCLFPDHVTLFKVYQYLSWGPLLGFVYGVPFMDTWFVMQGEKEFFLIQHAVLVGLNLWWMASGRYPAKHLTSSGSLRMFVKCYAGFMAYHAIVLLWLGRVVDMDYNSTRCAPLGSDALVGSWWREVNSCVMFLPALLTTYVPEQLIGLWLHTRTNSKSHAS